MTNLDGDKPTPVVITNMPELPFIKVVRWFRSREVIGYMANAVVIVVPLVLAKIGTLGLTDLQLLVWTIVATLGLNGAQTYLKATTKIPTVTGSKAAVEAAKEAETVTFTGTSGVK